MSVGFVLTTVVVAAYRVVAAAVRARVWERALVLTWTRRPVAGSPVLLAGRPAAAAR